MCKLYYYVQTTCYTSSVAILTVISLERYVAIIYPIHTRRLHDIRLLVTVVVSIWIVAAAAALHYLVIFDTQQVSAADGTTVVFCVTVHDFNAHLYTIISFVMWYAAPLTVMTIVYIRISVVLWKSSGISASSCSVSSSVDTTLIALHARSSFLNTSQMEAVGEIDPASVDRDERHPVMAQRQGRRRNAFAVSATAVTRHCSGDSMRLSDNTAVVSRRRKVIRMLVMVVVSFAVCVLPYHVRVIWQTFAQPQDVDDWQLVIPPLTFIAYYLNSAVNPLLYALLSDGFLSSLRDVLRGRCSRRSQTTLVTPAAIRLTARTLRTTQI